MNRTVVVLADDLFWKTKIDQATKSAQAPAVFISDPAGLVKAAETGKTALILVDLALRQDPFPAIAALKNGAKTKGIWVVGWYERAEGPRKEGDRSRLRPGDVAVGVLAEAGRPGHDRNFIVPSILSRGDLLIAVSTSGKSPAFARKVRVDLELLFGEEYGVFLNLMGNLRKEILRLGLSQEKNKSAFEELVNSDLLAAIKEKKWDLASRLVEKALGRPVSKNQILDLIKAE